MNLEAEHENARRTIDGATAQELAAAEATVRALVPWLEMDRGKRSAIQTRWVAAAIDDIRQKRRLTGMPATGLFPNERGPS